VLILNEKEENKIVNNDELSNSENQKKGGIKKKENKSILQNFG
jgi:hypothetical protein